MERRIVAQLLTCMDGKYRLNFKITRAFLTYLVDLNQ
jgi:hypothetical protein